MTDRKSDGQIGGQIHFYRKNGQAACSKHRQFTKTLKNQTLEDMVKYWPGKSPLSEIDPWLLPHRGKARISLV